jgi:hypothetical protein
MRANSAFNSAFVPFQQKIANDYARKQRFQQGFCPISTKNSK